MMTSEENTDDLIDLENTSSPPNLSCSPSEIHSDNLLDSGIASLAEKLKTTRPQGETAPSKPSVDIEDILITLDESGESDSDTLDALKQLDEVLDLAEYQEHVLDLDTNRILKISGCSTLPNRSRSSLGCSSSVFRSLRESSCTANDIIGKPWSRRSMRYLDRLPMPNDNISGGEVSVNVESNDDRVPTVLLASVEIDSGRSSRSGQSRSLTSSESSLESSVDTSPNANTSTTSLPNASHQSNIPRPCDRLPHNDMPEVQSPLGQWPHSLSSMFACLSCTVGLCNISRFATLTVCFGANFIFQFFLLSLVIGLPLFTLQLCLGQQLGAGVIDMWRISPVFQGVGVALLMSQVLIGLYSITGVSWMFVFFRDSFVTKVDRYRWAEPFIYYREDIQPPINGSYRLSETIPDYFSGVVLQRHHLTNGNLQGTVKFQLAFNLAVVWMIVFISLSKGLRSYGKVVFVFMLLPILGLFILCMKMLGVMSPQYVKVLFPETSWEEFFLNSKCWLAATQETFLTWGLLGPSIMQMASHNKHKHMLQRDSSLVAVMTFTILLLVAFLANTCVQILKSSGYMYLPDSFERISTYSFLRSRNDPLPPSLASTPVRLMPHYSFIVGERVSRSSAEQTSQSGYQVLRFATELIPTTFAVLGSEQISPFWVVLFYFTLILFGISQQLAIWHCVITGIMGIKSKLLKSWETTITLFSCCCGFLLGLPLATEFGIYIMYFLDYTIGGIWWLLLIIFLQIVAVFMVRGRPYSGDAIVTAIFHSNSGQYVLSWAPALLSFTWNVVLPVALMVMCITFFKNGNFKTLFTWHDRITGEYWPLWVRQLGSVIQLSPLLCVPVVAMIQSYRYINNGPDDILERIQLLYRPSIGEHMDDRAAHEAAVASLSNGVSTAVGASADDPPPKYTPPPSYTTATGAKIAKFLRNSLHRSIRRITNTLGESSNTTRERDLNGVVQISPPDYSAVLVEMNNPNISLSDRRTQELAEATTTTSNMTAAEVASILRNSFRRSTVRSCFRTLNNSSVSAESLVNAALPVGETSSVDDEVKNAANSSVI